MDAIRIKKSIGTTGRWFTSRGAVPVWLASLVLSSVPLGCGDDSDGSTGGTGAKGGSSGKSATGGSSGKGAKGGGAGSGANGGSTSGGSGGSSGTGTGGTSGTGGSAGKGGKGGSSGAGGATGGSGGMTMTGGTGAIGGTGAGEAGMSGSGGTGGSAGEAGSAGNGDVGGAGGESGTGGVACNAVGFTTDEQAAIAALGPLGALPADTTNAFADNAAAAALGQQFFFDKAFSGALAVDSDLGTTGQTGKVACVSCHSSPMMSDDRSGNVSLGANFHTRNAPGMVNSSFYPWTNWGGRFSTQWELPMPVTESGAILNSSRLQVAHVIYDKYKTEYEAVFSAYPLDAAIASYPATGKPKANSGDPNGNWENLPSDGDRAIVNRVFVNYAKALAAYTRKLVSRNSPFDRFMAGESCAISDSAKEGLKLFVGSAGCTHCHSGKSLSDGGFHNIGVAQTGAHVPASDDGRFKDIPGLIASGLSAGSATWSDDPTTGAAKINALSATDEANRAAFRTPSLRGVAQTAPYMHAGQLATLADVIDFYDRGGDTPSAGTKDASMTPLGLTTEQKASLVTFLTSLTPDPIDAALLTDTSK